MDSVLDVLYMDGKIRGQPFNGCGLSSEHHPIPWEMSKQCGIQNLSGCCLAIFWHDGLCIKLIPIGALPRVGAQPQHPFGHPPPSHIPP
jgi:hypothetical protein